MALKVSPITPEYKWDAGNARFRSSNGRYASREAVKSSSEAFVQKAQNDMLAASERFQQSAARAIAEGRPHDPLEAAQWMKAMEDGIRRTHLASEAIGVGGWDRMGPREWGTAGSRIKEAYKNFEVLKERVNSGYYGPDLARNGFLNHVSMHATDARGTFERAQARTNAETHDHDTIENILGAADHCSTGERIGCLEITEMGPMPLDSPDWVWPGDRQCINQCQCRAKTSKAAG